MADVVNTEDLIKKLNLITNLTDNMNTTDEKIEQLTGYISLYQKSLTDLKANYDALLEKYDTVNVMTPKIFKDFFVDEDITVPSISKVYKLEIPKDISLKYDIFVDDIDLNSVVTPEFFIRKNDSGQDALVNNTIQEMHNDMHTLDGPRGIFALKTINQSYYIYRYYAEVNQKSSQLESTAQKYTQPANLEDCVNNFNKYIKNIYFMPLEKDASGAESFTKNIILKFVDKKDSSNIMTKKINIRWIYKKLKLKMTYKDLNGINQTIEDSFERINKIDILNYFKNYRTEVLKAVSLNEDYQNIKNGIKTSADDYYLEDKQYYSGDNYLDIKSINYYVLSNLKTFLTNTYTTETKYLKNIVFDESSNIPRVKSATLYNPDPTKYVWYKSSDNGLTFNIYTGPNDLNFSEDSATSANLIIYRLYTHSSVLNANQFKNLYNILVKYSYPDSRGIYMNASSALPDYIQLNKENMNNTNLSIDDEGAKLFAVNQFVYTCIEYILNLAVNLKHYQLKQFQLSDNKQYSLSAIDEAITPQFRSDSIFKLKNKLIENNIISEEYFNDDNDFINRDVDYDHDIFDDVDILKYNENLYNYILTNNTQYSFIKYILLNYSPTDIIKFNQESTLSIVLNPFHIEENIISLHTPKRFAFLTKLDKMKYVYTMKRYHYASNTVNFPLTDDLLSIFNFYKSKYLDYIGITKSQMQLTTIPDTGKHDFIVAPITCGYEIKSDEVFKAHAWSDYPEKTFDSKYTVKSITNDNTLSINIKFTIEY